MVAINIRGGRLRDSGIELKSNPVLQFVQKTLPRPAMPQEEKL
jgi:hypothetical protein